MSRAVSTVLAFALVVAPSLLAGESTVQERITAYAGPLAESGFLSRCLLVTRGADELAHACFGYANAKRTVKNETSTRSCIASITKPITAVAIMRLVDQNKLRLDNKISQWIDDFPSGDEISVADVMTHSAGIPHRVTTQDEEVERFTPADIVARIKDKGLLFPPHTNQQYSSAGYTVLAYIIEQVTGKKYGDAMHELIFVPLKMHDTFHPDGRAIGNRATSFVAGADGPKEARAKDYAFLAGAGSLYSTPGDMVRFAHALLGRELLSDAAWKEWHELGWANNDVVRWSGSTNGFGSWMDIYKDDGSVHVFLGNAGTGASNILRAALPALVAGEEPAPAPRAPAPTTLTEEQMKGLEGGYGRGGGPASLVVAVEDGVLYMADSVVYPIAVDRFFNPTYFSEATFERDEGGLVTRIKITAPGLSQPLVFVRVSDE